MSPWPPAWRLLHRSRCTGELLALVEHAEAHGVAVFTDAMEVLGDGVAVCRRAATPDAPCHLVGPRVFLRGTNDEELRQRLREGLDALGVDSDDGEAR
ncbi:MAG: hypothetical protein CMN30_08395 [Sandaracinus sp.]|mgnify:CR=1 FL=1|nr:hypothetical protein [Sandaracinus sp.]